MQAGRRPVFLNLAQIRFPVTAVTSILHRGAGLLLFLLLPFLVLALQMSLRSADDFNQLLEWLGTPYIKVLLFVVLWSGLHHLLAGMRYLLLDIDVFIEKKQARQAAWLVNGLALLLAAVFFGVLL